MKPSYDVVVIGTGMGGSAAGALVAREGFKVLFLEKNPQIGGACSFYRKEGVHVDMGAHVFSRGNRGPIGDVQRRLGAERMISFQRCDPMMRFKGPGFDLAGRFQSYSLPLLGAAMLKQLRLPAREILPMARRMAEPLLVPAGSVRDLNAVNVEERLLASTREPALVLLTSIFMGLAFVIPLWEASSGEALWSTKKAFFDRSMGYPIGGAVAVPQAFIEAARGFGAQLETGTRVKAIRVSGCRVEGVETDRGELFSCRAVVSTTSLKDTVRLAGRGCFPAPYLRHVDGIKGSLGAVQAKILLDRRIVKEGVLVGVRDRRSAPGRPLTVEDTRKLWQDTQEGKIPELMSFYCPVPTNFDPSLAPPGMQLLTLTSAAPTTDRKGGDPQDAWIDAMLEGFFDIYPEARKHVVWIDRFSNRYLEQWLGKRGGPVISTGQQTGQVGPGRHPNITPVQGLFAAGDCAGARGIGTELACQSGIDCAELLIQSLCNRIV
ncbi:MAG: NAD(P)/FAD-dependent oxidoreductase [bacterium]